MDDINMDELSVALGNQVIYGNKPRLSENPNQTLPSNICWILSTLQRYKSSQTYINVDPTNGGLILDHGRTYDMNNFLKEITGQSSIAFAHESKTGPGGQNIYSAITFKDFIFTVAGDGLANTTNGITFMRLLRWAKRGYNGKEATTPVSKPSLHGKAINYDMEILAVAKAFIKTSTNFRPFGQSALEYFYNLGAQESEQTQIRFTDASFNWDNNINVQTVLLGFEVACISGFIPTAKSFMELKMKNAVHGAALVTTDMVDVFINLGTVDVGIYENLCLEALPYLGDTQLTANVMSKRDAHRFYRSSLNHSTPEPKKKGGKDWIHGYFERVFNFVVSKEGSLRRLIPNERDEIELRRSIFVANLIRGPSDLLWIYVGYAQKEPHLRDDLVPYLRAVIGAYYQDKINAAISIQLQRKLKKAK